ncbi:fimbrial protein [Enterobacter sp. MGH 16]|uniref:fimbrial protein n=1 Tax=Enterobacter cloacae complex TaxID=354276 RepID=UPI0003BF2FDD|nr:fimbrial protein [Enterobacter sp. MGH 16]ESN53169.1 hypothetical protein L362_00066 [Enterobacter sp. MGH 16]
MRKIIFALCLLLGASYDLMAACALSPNASFPVSEMAQQQVPFGRSIISVPPDVPVGTEIYRQTIYLSPALLANVACDSAGQFSFFYKYRTLPLPASSVTLGSKSGIVYETGIKGIGIMFWYSATGFPLSLQGTCTNASCSGAFSFQSDFSLFKIGDVEPGVIQGSNLPVARYSVGQSQTNAVDMLEVALSGSISITTPTCRLAEPNKVVLMGNESINSFSGKGSAAGWKDASIQLINCPTFYGNTGNRGSAGTWTGSTVNGSSTLIYNSLTLTLMPANGIVDATKGIMAINTTEPNSASGIGIQLVTNQSSVTPAALGTSTTTVLPTDGTAAFTFPLFARYIQTLDNVSAGSANGMLTYTVEYK